MYHIFQVYDYKGGEQRCSINLTKSAVIARLIEAYFGDEIFVEEEPTIESLSNLISSVIDANSSSYAGGDGVVLSIFETTTDSPKLKGLDVDNFIPDMAKVILDKGLYEVEDAD